MKAYKDVDRNGIDRYNAGAHGQTREQRPEQQPAYVAMHRSRYARFLAGCCTHCLYGGVYRSRLGRNAKPRLPPTRRHRECLPGRNPSRAETGVRYQTLRCSRNVPSGRGWTSLRFTCGLGFCCRRPKPGIQLVMPSTWQKLLPWPGRRGVLPLFFTPGLESAAVGVHANPGVEILAGSTSDFRAAF